MGRFNLFIEAEREPPGPRGSHGFHSITLMATWAALRMASLSCIRRRWKMDRWDRSDWRPSGASASMVRAFVAFRITLVVGLEQSSSMSGRTALASSAAYFPVGHRHWVSNSSALKAPSLNPHPVLLPEMSQGQCHLYPPSLPAQFWYTAPLHPTQAISYFLPLPVRSPNQPGCVTLPLS